MISLYDKASPEVIAEVTKVLQYDMNRRGEIGKPSRPQVNKYLVKMANLVKFDSYRVGTGLTWAYRNICRAHYKEFLVLYDFMESERCRKDELKKISNDLDTMGEEMCNWWIVKNILVPFGFPLRSKTTNMVKVQEWFNIEHTRYFSRSAHTLAKMNIRHNGTGDKFCVADVLKLKETLINVFEEKPYLRK